MKSKKSTKEPCSPSPSRALYHVYQKLNHLRDLAAESNYPNADWLSKRMEVSVRTIAEIREYKESGDI